MCSPQRSRRRQHVSSIVGLHLSSLFTSPHSCAATTIMTSAATSTVSSGEPWAIIASDHGTTAAIGDTSLPFHHRSLRGSITHTRQRQGCRCSHCRLPPPMLSCLRGHPQGLAVAELLGSASRLSFVQSLSSDPSSLTSSTAATASPEAQRAGQVRSRPLRRPSHARTAAVRLRLTSLSRRLLSLAVCRVRLPSTSAALQALKDAVDGLHGGVETFGRFLAFSHSGVCTPITPNGQMQLLPHVHRL